MVESVHFLHLVVVTVFTNNIIDAQGHVLVSTILVMQLWNMSSPRCPSWQLVAHFSPRIAAGQTSPVGLQSFNAYIAGPKF